MRCASPLRQPCLACGEEVPVWARFCASCGHPFALPEARQERQTLVGFGLPEGAPTVPGAPAGPQIGAPGVPSAPAGSQAGMPTVPAAPAGPQGGAPMVPSAPANSQAGTAGRLAGQGAGKAIGRSVGSKLLSTAAGKVIAAVIAVMVVATGGTAAAVAVGHNPIATVVQQITGHGTTTSTPPPPELTYIGSDGNVWDVTLPQGKPRQLTSDAFVNPDDLSDSTYYAGLAWSPDGQYLALIRTARTDSASSSELLVFSPAGSLLWKQAMSQSPLSNSLAWSPDGRFIAYTQATQNYNYGSDGDDLEGELVRVDARTGSITSTLNYDAGPMGACGGGGDALTGVIWAAHRAHMGVNTFDWSSDGQKMLVAFNDAGSQSALVALSNGATTSGYPMGASFQPGGQLILGVGRYLGSDNFDMPLELTDLAGEQVRILADSTEDGTSSYMNSVGQATWSSDGKTIYYEYQDSIWRITVDGSGAQQIIAGTPLVNDQVTVELAPKLSPDGSRLLYLEARGVIDETDYSNSSVTAQWYVALADGSGAFALPQGTLAAQQNIVEAIWRPER